MGASVLRNQTEMVGFVPSDPIRVGMTEMHMGTPPDVFITTVGSCVALCIYDRRKKIGGMAHIVLPVSERFKNNGSQYKFADTAVPALRSALISKGAGSIDLEAKIAGGANMFPKLSKSVLKIGQENISVVQKKIKQLGIRRTAKDVGGVMGRKIRFELSTGRVVVQKLKGEVIIL
jgi:chemotaxis protein CheD